MVLPNPTFQEVTKRQWSSHIFCSIKSEKFIKWIKINSGKICYCYLISPAAPEVTIAANVGFNFQPGNNKNRR